MLLRWLASRGDGLPAATAAVAMLLSRLPALVAYSGVPHISRAVSAAARFTATASFALASSGSRRRFRFGVSRIVREGTLTLLPRTAVFPVPAFARPLLFVAISSRSLRALILASAATLGPAVGTSSRALDLRSRLRYEIHYRKAVMVFRVVGVMAMRKSALLSRSPPCTWRTHLSSPRLQISA